MRIVKAKEEHINQIIMLCEEMHKESVYNTIKINYETLTCFLLRHILSQDSLFLVLESNKKIIGMFIAVLDYYFFSDEMLSQDLIFYIKKENRGTSAAYDIACKYIAWCKEKGVREACLSSTTGITPEKIHSFYKGLGFDSVGFITKKTINLKEINYGRKR